MIKKLHNYNMFSNLDKEQKTLQSIVFLNSWGDQSLKWIQLRFAKTYTCFLNISQYEWVYRPNSLSSILSMQNSSDLSVQLANSKIALIKISSAHVSPHAIAWSLTLNLIKCVNDPILLASVT